MKMIEKEILMLTVRSQSDSELKDGQGGIFNGSWRFKSRVQFKDEYSRMIEGFGWFELEGFQ